MNLRPLALICTAASTFMVVGCGSSVDNTPPAAAMTPHAPVVPPKTPTTVEEKIQAIEKSSLPEDQKKAAIDSVKSGKL